MKFLALTCVLGLIAFAGAKSKNVGENDLESTGEVYVQKHSACRNHHCSLGKECRLDEDGKAMCDCAKSCPLEPDDRAKVCSDKNMTFDSECEFHRLKCQCHRHEEGCPDKHYAHMHLDYYGACKEISACSEYELMEFPFRMREWLFYVMEELASREELPKHASKLAKEAEKSLQEDQLQSDTRKWMIPVVWKFCDIDESHDSRLNQEEMHPLVAPIKSMEPCLTPFLEKCDADNSGAIAMDEWATCLQLNPAEIEMRCSSFHD